MRWESSRNTLSAVTSEKPNALEPQHLHHVVVVVPVDNVHRRQDLLPESGGRQREGRLSLEEIRHEEHLGHKSEVRISKRLERAGNRPKGGLGNTGSWKRGPKS